MTEPMTKESRPLYRAEDMAWDHGNRSLHSPQRTVTDDCNPAQAGLRLAQAQPSGLHPRPTALLPGHIILPRRKEQPPTHGGVLHPVIPAQFTNHALPT